MYDLGRAERRKPPVYDRHRPSASAARLANTLSSLKPFDAIAACQLLHAEEIGGMGARLDLAEPLLFGACLRLRLGEDRRRRRTRDDHDPIRVAHDDVAG